MSDSTGEHIQSKAEYLDKVFTNINVSKTHLTHSAFEGCQFKGCDLSDTTIEHCKFVDCEFISCNVSMAQFKFSAFSEVVFDDSKLVGINWTQVKWPNIRLTSPIKLYRSNISQSSFYDLELTEISIEDCKAHEVDFREADLSCGIFSQTDFSGSLFMHTKLHGADFRDAINYYIDPNQNEINKAKFSMPDAINLLQAFDIEIE